MHQNVKTNLRTQNEAAVIVVPAASSGFGHSVRVEIRPR